MLKSIAKTTLFVCVILLLGQARLGNKSIAGHFTYTVLHLFVMGEIGLEHNPLFSRFAKKTAVPAPGAKPDAKALVKHAPTRYRPDEASLEDSTPVEPPPGPNDREAVTTSDQEKLLRLLQ